MGVSVTRARHYEAGLREVSISELELLAVYLRVPLSYFLNPDSKIEDDTPMPPPLEKIKSLRALIGAQLKKARTSAGRSREECAQAAQIKPARLGRYERGLDDIPITTLIRLAEYFGVNVFYFLQDGQREESSDVLDLERLARLPREVRSFVLNSENLPYLRMAQKFRDLPHDKLKELGEILLVVR